MKIAFILRAFPKISETFILNQITGMINLGHDIEIFAFNNPKEEIIHPDILKYSLMTMVTYIRVPKNKIVRTFKALCVIFKNIFFQPKIILSSLNFFKYKNDSISLRLLFYVSPFLKKNFDIIHCFYGPNGIFGIMLKDTGAVKGKIVTSFHGYDLSRVLSNSRQDFYKNLFKYGDLFLPVCEYFKNKLIALGCDENKIIVHRTGIDLDRFRPVNFKKVKNEKIRILSVGRLVEKKGFIYGIKAVKLLLEKYPDVEYNIIGDGPLLQSLNNSIKELDLTGKVNILGFLANSNVIKLIRISDILIAPSVIAKDGNIEGIPNVLKEALAMKVPVIASLHGGIPELIIDNYTGFLTPEKDIGKLAEKISYLIDNENMRINIGLNGYNIVRKYYDIKKLNLELANIYKMLTDN